MVVIVYAHAYNEISVPVTACTDMKTAIEILTPILGGPTLVTTREIKWSMPDGKFDSPEMKEWDAKMEKLFLHYNDGCDIVGAIVALEIKNGELKQFPFDLD